MLLNNTRYYFFFALIGIIILSPTIAFAEIEKGINYDRELIQTKYDGSKVYRWTSTPFSADRILDQNGIYQNYIVREDSNNVYFESAQGSISFNKSTCSLSTYDPGYIDSSYQFKLSHSIKEAINGTDVWSEAEENTYECQYTLEKLEYVIKITAIRGDFKVLYEIDSTYGFEWTYYYTNNKIEDGNKKIGFTFVCDGEKCDDIKINGFEVNGENLTKENLKGKKIKVGDMLFDTKDNIHDALWLLKKKDNKLIVDFTNAKQPVGYNETIVVDPTFTSSVPEYYTYIYDNGGSGTACDTTSLVNNAGTGSIIVGVERDINAQECYRGVIQWNTTSINDGYLITDTDVTIDISSVTAVVRTTNFTAIQFKPSTATTLTKFNDAGNGTSYTAFTPVVGDNQSFDLGPIADTDLRDKLSENYFAVGLRASYEVPSTVNEFFTIDVATGTPKPTLTVIYVVGPPNSVTTLAASGTTTTTTNLSWSSPNLNGGVLQRYVINYTTPCGIPTTHLANGTTSTSYAVSSLTAATCYSFRVTAATNGGYNITGANIVNVTTLAFNEANFTIGGFNYQADNPMRLPIRYERIDSGSDTRVNVTFANSVNLACDLRYTYAGTNHTYHAIPSIVISSTEKEASFNLVNSTNEIVTFHCWNQSGNQSANYVLTQTDFLLLQQIEDFRNGTYGTMGQLGAFDFVALIIIIISMIGLNRNNEAVGGIFCIIAISIMAYFDIVSWVTAIVAAAAVILMLLVSSVKKD